MDSLKPCPFCGEKGIILNSLDGHYSAVCSNYKCKANITIAYGKRERLREPSVFINKTGRLSQQERAREMAVKLWNTRSDGETDG